MLIPSSLLLMYDSHIPSPTLILPVGTHVVTTVEAEGSSGVTRPPGAVGAIVEAPTDNERAY